jgi:DNA-binding SARP family transcriptional activator
MMKPKQLNRSIAATARYARAVSKTIARLEERHPTNNEAFSKELMAIYRSGSNVRVNNRLRRLRRTEIPRRTK